MRPGSRPPSVKHSRYATREPPPSVKHSADVAPQRTARMIRRAQRACQPHQWSSTDTVRVRVDALCKARRTCRRLAGSFNSGKARSIAMISARSRLSVTSAPTRANSRSRSPLQSPRLGHSQSSVRAAPCIRTPSLGSTSRDPSAPFASGTHSSRIPAARHRPSPNGTRHALRELGCP